MVAALDKKLWRDLWRLRGQASAIAVLVACAVAVFVGATSTYLALERTQASYYRAFGFADLFAEARRVPEPVARRLAGIPGVATVETRLLADAALELARPSAPGAIPEPRTARLVSVAPGGGALNRVYVRSGRALAPDATDEVLVSEGFAQANHLGPGEPLVLVVNGRRQSVRIVGVALSPEFVYAIRSGDLFPDDRHFAVVWMPRAALAPTLDMEGAFNAVSLRLWAGAQPRAVITEVDRALAAYGGLGAYGRDRQVSHRFLSDEVLQLRALAATVPTIFFGVAAYLLAVVMSRQVATQRQQIGTLRALGYERHTIGFHFAKLAVAVAMTGSAAGVLGGLWIGRALAEMYAEFYRFPILVYDSNTSAIVYATLLALAAALLGVAGAARRAVILAPAEAMRPEPPAVYRAGIVERLGFTRLLSPVGRMAWRNLQRRPVRAILNTIGLSAAVAVLVVGAFMPDALDFMMQLAFEKAQRQDVTVTFNRPVASGPALAELRAIPGVLEAEPFRAVAVRLEHGRRRYHTALMGMPADAELQRLVGSDGARISIPSEGLVLSRKLGELLEVQVGESVRIAVLEGRRPALELLVSALVDDVLGVSATMALPALHRALEEGPMASGAYLGTDPARTDTVAATLRQRPQVVGVMLREAAIQSFRGTFRETLLGMAAVFVAFAIAIAAGVVYNAGRISFAERERELATLRVLGFRRGEAFRVLAGELAVELVLALPLGSLFGLALATLAAAGMESDLFRIPVVVDRSTYVFAALVTVGASAAVSALMYRSVAALDLVEVLKSKE